MFSGAPTLKLTTAVALGPQAIWIAVAVVGVIVVLCATIVILVFATAEADRPKVIARLTPVLERLADGISVHAATREQRAERRTRR